VFLRIAFCGKVRRQMRELGFASALAVLSLGAWACSSDDGGATPPAPPYSAKPKIDASLAAAESARAGFTLPPPRPIASGSPLVLESPRVASVVMPPGFQKSDSGFQFVQGTRGDLELTLVAGEDKGALDADADLRSTLSTDPRAMARRFDAGDLHGVLEALPVETDGKGKSWERLHFRAWVDIADGSGVRVVLNLKFPAGSRDEHVQEFSDVVATLTVAPAASPSASASSSAAPSAGPPPAAAQSTSK
jgi:hypothetical protein